MAKVDAQKRLEAKILSEIPGSVSRSRFVYAGPLAVKLEQAAKDLCKITDATIRVKLFLKIVLRTVKCLKIVDDSNALLQRVLWEGNYCSDVFRQICLESDESTLKLIFQKVLAIDDELLTKYLFFPEVPLPLSEDVLRNLIDFLTVEFKAADREQREEIGEACLMWAAYLKDEALFNRLCKEKKLKEWYIWEKRFLLELNLERYDAAKALVDQYAADYPSSRRECYFQIFERNRDRKLLLEIALQAANNLPSVETYKRLRSLLNEEEHLQFMDAMVAAAKRSKFFDISACEVLFEAGELGVLREYLISRYEEIYQLHRCTGMVPLGKKLFAKGEVLAACILVRGTIYYLMSRKNSKYYPDVHRYYSLLAEMSNHVTDWGNIPSDVAFTNRFSAEFGNRRMFWG